MSAQRLVKRIEISFRQSSLYFEDRRCTLLAQLFSRNLPTMYIGTGNVCCKRFVNFSEFLKPFELHIPLSRRFDSDF